MTIGQEEQCTMGLITTGPMGLTTDRKGLQSVQVYDSPSKGTNRIFAINTHPFVHDIHLRMDS